MNDFVVNKCKKNQCILIQNHKNLKIILLIHKKESLIQSTTLSFQIRMANFRIKK